jgi:hypothetical protein
MHFVTTRGVSTVCIANANWHIKFAVPDGVQVEFTFGGYPPCLLGGIQSVNGRYRS